MADAPEWALHFGTERRRVVIAGHSHVICVLQALGAAWRDDVSVAYNAVLSDGPPLDDAYWGFVRDVTSDQLIAIMWNGNQHHSSFLVRPDPPISVCDPAVPGGTESGATLVPRAMLAALWEPSFQQLRRALDLLVPERRVVLLGTPPPKRQAEVLANLAREPWFAEAARAHGVSAVDVTGELDRLRMWRIVQQRLREIAGDYGVVFVPGPADAVDGDGFLLAAFSADDATHANGAYGELLCDELERLVAL